MKWLLFPLLPLVVTFSPAMRFCFSCRKATCSLCFALLSDQPLPQQGDQLGSMNLYSTCDYTVPRVEKGFPGGLAITNLPANAREADSIPGWDRCPREGNGNPLEYSCLGNFIDRRSWQITVHGAKKSLKSKRVIELHSSCVNGYFTQK